MRHVRLLRYLKTVTRELTQDGKGVILFTIAAGWFLSIGVRFAYPSLLPFFQEDFGFGLSTAGLLVSLLWVAYALGQFPGGILGDRIGEGNILVISSVIATGTILLVALSVNVWMLFAGTILFGFATSLYGPTRFTVFTDIYDSRAGTAVGLSHASGSIGNTVLPALATAIASYASWRAGYAILIPAFLGITVALWLWVPGRTSPNHHADGGGPVLPIRRILSSISRGGIPIIVTIQVLIGFVSQGFLAFYPTYLMEVKELSATAAAVLYGLYFAVGILVQPLTGLANDRIGPRATLSLLIGLYFTGMVGLFFAQTIPHVLALTVLLSNRNGTGVVTNTFIADALYEDIKGAGLGFLRTGWLLVGAASPALVGFLGDAGQLQYAFVLLAGIAGVGVLLTVFVPSEYH